MKNDKREYNVTVSMEITIRADSARTAQSLVTAAVNHAVPGRLVKLNVKSKER